MSSPLPNASPTGLWALHVGHSNSVNRRFLPGAPLANSSSSSTSKCLSRPPGAMTGDYIGFATPSRISKAGPALQAGSLAGPRPEAHLRSMLACVAAALVASSSVQIWIADESEKVLPDATPRRAKEPARIRFSAAGGECIGAQIVVRSEKGVKALSASAQPLVSAEERALPATGGGRRPEHPTARVSLDVMRVATILLARPTEPEGRAGEWPDALIPVRDPRLRHHRAPARDHALRRHAEHAALSGTRRRGEDRLEGLRRRGSAVPRGNRATRRSPLDLGRAARAENAHPGTAEILAPRLDVPFPGAGLARQALRLCRGRARCEGLRPRRAARARGARGRSLDPASRHHGLVRPASQHRRLGAAAQLPRRGVAQLPAAGRSKPLPGRGSKGRVGVVVSELYVARLRSERRGPSAAPRRFHRMARLRHRRARDGGASDGGARLRERHRRPPVLRRRLLLRLLRSLAAAVRIRRPWPRERFIPGNPGADRRRPQRAGLRQS